MSARRSLVSIYSPMKLKPKRLNKINHGALIIGPEDCACYK